MTNQPTYEELQQRLKQTEQELRHQKARLESIIHRNNLPTVILDQKRRITECNKAFEKLFSLSPSEIQDNDLINLIVREEDLKSARAYTEKIFRGKAIRARDRRCTKDGDPLDVEISGTPLVSDGEIIGAHVIYLDIGELKRSNKQLAENLSLLNATLDSTIDGILVVDRKGKIATFNRKFMQMWQLPDSIIESGDDNQTLDYVVNQLKDPPAFLSKVRELYSSPDAESFDQLEFKDGRIFERYSLPQRLDNKPVGRIWSFRDVTEKRKAFKALQEESQKLHQTLKTKDLLLREVHHRVKNNLQLILSLLNLELSGNREGGDSRQLLKESHSRITTLAVLHENLYRAEDLTLDIERYIKDLVGKLVGLYATGKSKINRSFEIREKNLDIDTSITCGLIINEVVSNSLKHAFTENRQYTLKIALLPVGNGNTELLISDNGSGIPENTEIEAGQTLGLRLVRMLAEDQLDGTLQIEAGNGTRCRIRFCGGKINDAK